MGQGSFQHACSVLEALISSTVFETAEKQYSFQCSSGILLEALEFMALPTSWSAFPCTVHAGGEPCSISAGVVQSARQASGASAGDPSLDSETFDSQADTGRPHGLQVEFSDAYFALAHDSCTMSVASLVGWCTSSCERELPLQLRVKQNGAGFFLVDQVLVHAVRACAHDAGTGIGQVALVALHYVADAREADVASCFGPRHGVRHRQAGGCVAFGGVTSLHSCPDQGS